MNKTRLILVSILPYTAEELKNDDSIYGYEGGNSTSAEEVLQISASLP